MKTAQLPIYLLERVYLKDRTLGSIISSQGGLICKTLELPWLDNARGKSCIKEGLYTVTWSPPVLPDNPGTAVDESGGRHARPYDHYIVNGVPGRSGILIHRGNNPTHSLGCILVGSRFGNFETDTPTLEDSGAKLQWMVETMPKKFKLRVLAKSGNPYA
jgi:hypothetical protein